MKKLWSILLLMAMALVFSSSALAGSLNPGIEYGTYAYGAYYLMTAGQSPNGQTRDGVNSTGAGGVIRFITDEPGWKKPMDQWQKEDDWYTQTKGLALTMKNQGAIVFNNNGIETHTTAGFYQYTSNPNEAGCYVGFSMSNNWDWIYAGYFTISVPTTVDTLIGYWNKGPVSGNASIDPNSPNIRFRMNIFSEDPSTLVPAVASFTGNIFSSDLASGAFSTSDTGENRISSDTPPGDIYRLTYILGTPLILAPGNYYFSHDVQILPLYEGQTVPLPGAVWLLGSGLAGLGLWRGRKLLKA